MLNENFLKSRLHIIKTHHARSVNKNEFKLLSVNNKKPNTTVKTVSDSQYGSNVDNFSFLYAYCSNHSDNIPNIAVRINNHPIKNPILSKLRKKYQKTHNHQVIIAQMSWYNLLDKIPSVNSRDFL